MALAAIPVLAQQPTGAPVPPVPVVARPDTVRPAIPVSAVGDSVVRDTVKAPLAVAERPASPEIRGRRTVWDRTALFASGALTLPELLAQVPGATVFNAGFIAAPTATSWYGDPGRVRVFLDGVELDGLDPRAGAVQDLSTVQIAALEEVAVERAAGELRVFLRSWRVRLTTASTRTDITTGSENTNLYRGFFGKRTNSGGVLQVAAQQYSTTSVRTAGDGDALAAFGRVGFARGRLTVDAVGSRFGRTRSATFRNVISGTLDPKAIGAFEGNSAAGYVRAAWGDADSSGLWFQAIAASLRHEETGDSTPGADTARSMTQYVATAGVTRWGARLSATARMRVQEGESRLSPTLRAAWERKWVALSGMVEEGGPDSTRRIDAIAALTPFPWLHLSAAHSIHTPDDSAAGGPIRTTSRAEAAVRVYGRWISVGAVQRSASRALGMPVFDSLFVAADIAASTGLEGGLSGQIWGPFSFDWRGIRWAEPALYRPQVESHAEVRVASDFLKQIKRGTFGLTAGLTHDYRGAVEMPAAPGSVRRAEGAGWVGGYLEMRIGTARIFWYNRNAVGKVYETVPGYLMPRLVQLYGLRWEFWN
ncbi:MAG: hypothetical protein K8S21_04590 [Gemmatimonadetes bacterium]|nr:hypothetical protein [Gemmatimonadota bacterium]